VAAYTPAPYDKPTEAVFCNGESCGKRGRGDAYGSVRDDELPFSAFQKEDALVRRRSTGRCVFHISNAATFGRSSTFYELATGGFLVRSRARCTHARTSRVRAMHSSDGEEVEDPRVSGERRRLSRCSRMSYRVRSFSYSIVRAAVDYSRLRREKKRAGIKVILSSRGLRERGTPVTRIRLTHLGRGIFMRGPRHAVKRSLLPSPIKFMTSDH